MTKNKELVKNTAIISVGKICTQFLSFLLLPLYTSLLTTQEYGSVDLVTTYQQLLGYVAFFQIEQAVFRFLIDVRKERDNQTEIITSVFLFAVMQAIVLCGILFVVSLFFYIEYLRELYLYCVVVVFAGLMLQISRGLGNNVLYSVGSFISAISTIVFNIIFLSVFHFGAEGMLYSFILGNLLCILFLVFRLKIYKYIVFKSFSLKCLKDCLKYSLPLVPNVLSWWIMGASDRTIVSFVIGKAANGFLSVSHKFSSAYTSFYTIFNLSWTESAAVHFHDDDHEEFFRSVIVRIYKLFFAGGICIIAIMPFIFPLLIDSKFSDAYYQIPIYMIASFFNVIQGLYSVIYVAMKKTKEIAKTTVVSAIINIAVNLLLIHFIGLYAASISSVVAYGTNSVWRYFDLKKYTNVTLGKKLLLSSFLVISAVTALYYFQNIIGQIIGLVLALAFSVFLNREILIILIKSPKQLMKKLTSKK